MTRRLFLAAWAGLLVLGPGADAQDPQPLVASPPTVKSALTEVISRQLDAFRAGDFAKAYSFASSGIQKIFPPATFEQMVRTSYPMILQPGKVDFGAALDNGEDGVVFVRLINSAGKSGLFRYLLMREEGGWKITGVEQADEDAPPGRPPVTA